MSDQPSIHPAASGEESRRDRRTSDSEGIAAKVGAAAEPRDAARTTTGTMEAMTSMPMHEPDPVVLQEHAEFEASATPDSRALLDIDLEARIQFGAREMLLHQLLELSSGDVLELDRLISDPVDLLVGDRIVARGEVVVVGGNFALQVLEVMQPKPRLESVRCLL